MVIGEINDMKMKLSNKVTLRKKGKTKLGSELSAKALNSAKGKQIDVVIDMGQGDDRLFGTSRTRTAVAILSPIPMAGLRSALYKTKRSDRHPSGARGHLIALKNKAAVQGYLEEMIQGTTMKQTAYGTLVSSERERWINW